MNSHYMKFMKKHFNIWIYWTIW